MLAALFTGCQGQPCEDMIKQAGCGLPFHADQVHDRHARTAEQLDAHAAAVMDG